MLDDVWNDDINLGEASCVGLEKKAEALFCSFVVFGLTPAIFHDDEYQPQNSRKKKEGTGTRCQKHVGLKCTHTLNTHSIWPSSRRLVGNMCTDPFIHTSMKPNYICLTAFPKAPATHSSLNHRGYETKAGV